jgi:hypothetical protein
MTTDRQFKALGTSGPPPTEVAFQTDGANILVGVDVRGQFGGVKGHCDRDGDGIFGTGPVGVHGVATRAAAAFNDGPGVLGESERGPGVVGNSRAVSGVQGEGVVGVLGLAQAPGLTFPAAPSSVGVFGVFGDLGPALGPAGTAGTSSTATGIAGSSSVAPGVFGISSAPDQSSIHGQRGAGGRPVDASAVLGTTDNVLGAGVAGSALNTNGVFGLSGPDSGPPLGLAGVVGTSSTVTGVAGSAGAAPGIFGLSTSPSHSSIVGQRGTSEQLRPVDASGVLGTNNTDHGAGVSGVALKDSTAGVFGLLGTNAGPAVGAAGVVGTSNVAPGIAGSSSASYGGRFTGGLAPLLLDPASLRDRRRREPTSVASCW